MHETYLLPENIARQDGSSAEIALESNRGKPLLLTLGITHIVEQESLELSLSGSVDRENWKQLAAFPKKFYCGTYTLLLDLPSHPEVRYLRADWKMACWGRGDAPIPLVGFFLRAEELKLQAMGAA